MESKTIYWSEEKQLYLRDQLSAIWAKDIWIFTNQKKPSQKSSIQFTLTSEYLKIELKYALWFMFERGKRDKEKQQCSLCREMSKIIKWLNQCAPATQSLMEKSFEQWETSLKAYLIQLRCYKIRQANALVAAQKYVQYNYRDEHICLLNQLYTIILHAYDERIETEKDIWDMRKMGLAVDLTTSHFFLKFTSISQPWLRHLAKEFMKYNTAVNSPADSRRKLGSIQRFARFISEYTPTACVSNIDRTLIVKYITFLHNNGLSDKEKGVALKDLRLFLETCTHELKVEGFTRERLIFDSDYPKLISRLSRELPEEILKQLRASLNMLPLTISRMVLILLECGLRLQELCSLPIDCLIHDDKHEWYLRFFQAKLKQENIIPLVNETVIGVIQAQQKEIREQWGTSCSYLFPSLTSPTLPFKQIAFSQLLNKWAYKANICDATGKLFRFQSHQFRHTVGMRLINEDVPLDVISRLFGHRNLSTTEIYARKRAAKLREALVRVARRTVNSQGEIVIGDIRANDADVQLVRKEIRGQTLPVGGCGRPIIRGDCEHANKCLTCTFWLTSTDDLPQLHTFYSKALHLRQLAITSGNEFVVKNQNRILPTLALRIAKLESVSEEGSLTTTELLAQLRADLMEAESGLAEACEARRVVASKCLTRIINDLNADITMLEETL